MRISVITHSFNQGRFLEATLQSVLAQRYPDFEHIVIDGGSRDESVSVLEKHNDALAYWVSEKDRGQSDAFNKGLRKATGDIIGWLNSDDIYIGDCLKQVADYFVAHPEVDVVFSDYWFIDEHGNFLRKRKEIPFRIGVYLWTGDCYHANCAGFFRRRVFEKIGGLDEGLHFGMDYDFYMRAAEAGFRFGHVHECWGGYRLHDQSKSISAHHLQIQDALLVSERHRPPNVTGFGSRWRYYAYKSFRIAWKALIGSYFPSKPNGQVT